MRSLLFTVSVSKLRPYLLILPPQVRMAFIGIPIRVHVQYILVLVEIGDVSVQKTNVSSKQSCCGRKISQKGTSMYPSDRKSIELCSFRNARLFSHSNPGPTVTKSAGG
jgi:hypothetical protein